MVTPMILNLKLDVESEGDAWRICQVYDTGADIDDLSQAEEKKLAEDDA